MYQRFSDIINLTIITNMIKYILIFLLAASSLKAQWTQSAGIPSNHMVYSFTSCNGKMFAGTGVSILTSGALQSSADNGVTWSEVNLNWPGLSSVMCLGTLDNYIFAGTYEDNLFISSNAGANWSNVVLNNAAGIFQLGVSGSNVVCYTNGQGPAWVSTNKGANWSITGAGVLAIINDFLSADGKFFATGRNGLYVSTNDGVSWTVAANNGAPSNPDGTKPMSGLLYKNGILYANCLRKIIYSSDFGNNWTETNINLSNFTTSYSLVSYGGRIYGSLYGINDTSKGVITTSNNGTNWFSLNKGFDAPTNVRRLFINNEFILAGTYFKGIYRIPLSILTGTGNQNEIVKDFSLKQNYPNPFNPETKINFSINQKGFTSLKVYDSMGRLVSILVSNELEAGNHSYAFSGEKLSSGIYFYKLETGNFSDTKRMILIK